MGLRLDVTWMILVRHRGFVVLRVALVSDQISMHLIG